MNLIQPKTTFNKSYSHISINLLPIHGLRCKNEGTHQPVRHGHRDYTISSSLIVFDKTFFTQVVLFYIQFI